MDYLAQANMRPGTRMVSIQWASWKETGLGEVKSRAYRQSGLLSHTDAEGLKWLDQILAARVSGVILPASVNPAQWQPERLLRRPPLLKAATDAQRTGMPDSDEAEEQFAAVSQAVGNEATSALGSLAATPLAGLEDVQQWVKQLFAQQLRLELSRLDVETPLPNYGVDSVMLMQVLGPIGERVGATLDPSILYEHDTIGAFSKWLLGTHGAALARSGKSTIAQLSPSIEDAATSLRDASNTAVKGASATDQSTAIVRQIPDSPIAVVGLACRFAGANDVEEYWDLLASGRSAIRRVPQERWGVAGEHYAGLLDDIRHFDAAFFRLSEADARAMDPQALLILEESLKVWHDAGYTPAEVKGSRIGVYLGARSQHHPGEDRLRAAQNPILATGQNYLAANVSHYFDLRGPSMVVDTACSSALVALNLAIQSLRAGEVTAALVGGATVLHSDAALRMFEERGILQPDGIFHMFDARARGAILGEGVGLVLLKTFEQAQADGDRVYTLINAIAINNDGLTAGPTAPNMRAQQEVMKTALARSGKRVEDISYIEVNGSGSEVTDLLELKAIEAVYRNASRTPCELGSMKPNIGHPLCAEGIASLIKVALMLHKRQRVPFLSAQQPLKHYDLETSVFRFNRNVSPWTEAPCVAAINCFADGGTNAHVILEACPPMEHTPNRQRIAPPELRKIDLGAAPRAVHSAHILVRAKTGRVHRSRKTVGTFTPAPTNADVSGSAFWERFE
jgi:polyketide synthase PksN